MPAGIKRALEVILARGGPAVAARAARRRGVLILAYHNVIPSDAPPAGERSLHLSADRFRRQLDLIQRWLTVGTLPDTVGPAADDARPRVVITFDDAYRGAVTIALPELRARGLPATMFVAPGRLGGNQFWWDALADAGTMADDARHHALEELRGDENEVRSWAARVGLPLRTVPDLWRSASEAELAAAVYPGLMLGSHSWSHPNLARLSAGEVGRELAASHDWLVDRFPRFYVPWLAFPYGRFSREACDAAGARGFSGALRIDGGWTRVPLREPLAAPRMNVPAGLSTDGFALRASGLLRS
jgi:peptidoglycan/xylan/chitin deacetylase (PgdA/CDA1 family)